MDTTFAELLIFPEGDSEAVAVIRNHGREPMVVEQAGSSAPFFVVAAEPPFGMPVAAAGAMRVTIRFAPDAPGTYARLVDVGGTAILCEGRQTSGTNCVPDARRPAPGYSVTAFNASTIPLPKKLL